MVKGLRSLIIIGVRQQSPRRQREEDDPVSDRPCHSPDARPGRRSGVPAEPQPPKPLPHPPGACRRVYRQLIVPCPNAVMEIEAKVRRYTGRRCICPAPSMRRRGRCQPRIAANIAAGIGRLRITFVCALIIRCGQGGRRVWLNWQGAFFAMSKHRSGGKGWTLAMSDRLSGRAWPFAPGFCQPWQVGCCLAKRAERGAERCHSILPKRGSLQRPVRKSMAANGDGTRDTVKPRAGPAA